MMDRKTIVLLWKLFWFVAVVVGLLLVSVSRSRGGELSGTVPKGVPDPSRWPVRPADESITSGTFRLANTELTVTLSVEPGFPAIYRVSAYRTCDYAAKVCDPETLLWLRPTKPGGHGVVAMIYHRFQRRTWKKLWIGREWYWHQLPRGSPEYRMEAKRAGALFFLLDMIRDGADPASLTF